MKSIIEKSLSRRKFVAGAGGVAAASMLTGLVGCGDSSNNNGSGSGTGGTGGTGGGGTGGGGTTTFTDADVLNFALNLEYLEAQFYLYAATGQGLSASDTAAPTGYTGSYTMGTVTTNSSVTMVPSLTSQQQDILNEIAFEEQAHVRFLRSALGSAAVPMPSIDLTFFAGLATAASIVTPSPYTPFDNFNDFLLGAFIFEDVGVTAYAGAAPLISAAGVAAGYLTAAAGILAVEAYHAAYVRTALTGSAIAAGSATAYPYLGFANQVAALRAALTVGDSGAPSTATGNTGAPDSSSSVETSLILPTSTTTASAIVACDPMNALGFARDVNQVHHIVYGSATVGVAKGGFFPNGTNSIFATTTA